MRIAPASDGSNIAAVVVTYNPRHSLEPLLGALAKQVAGLVVVDNGSEPDLADSIRAAAARHGAHMLPNAENEGIATALNQGTAWARQKQKAWILLLDQDSEIGNALVANLVRLHAVHPAKNCLAIVAANFTDSVTGTTVLRSQGLGGRGWFYSKAAVTSGSLLSLAAFESIGPFREDFFVDHVDTEYGLRANKHGLKVIVSTAPLMVHSIGAGSVGRIAGVYTTRTTNHSAVRRYYGTRNFVVIAREYFRTDFVHVMYLLKQLTKSIILIVLLEDHKLLKLRYMLIGFSHGLRGRLGKWQD